MIGVGFDYHMNLHYSQTQPCLIIRLFSFDYHMNLHYSQTIFFSSVVHVRFDYHMNLHYSQTSVQKFNDITSLTII